VKHLKEFLKNLVVVLWCQEYWANLEAGIWAGLEEVGGN
jgi:hypothetical protein